MCFLQDGQFALSYIGPTLWNKTSDKFKRTNNLNAFKHNLKRYFLNVLKNYLFSFSTISILILSMDFNFEEHFFFADGPQRKYKLI